MRKRSATDFTGCKRPTKILVFVAGSQTSSSAFGMPLLYACEGHTVRRDSDITSFLRVLIVRFSGQTRTLSPRHTTPAVSNILSAQPFGRLQTKRTKPSLLPGLRKFPRQKYLNPYHNMCRLSIKIFRYYRMSRGWRCRIFSENWFFCGNMCIKYNPEAGRGQMFPLGLIRPGDCLSRQVSNWTRTVF